MNRRGHPVGTWAIWNLSTCGLRALGTPGRKERRRHTWYTLGKRDLLTYLPFERAAGRAREGDGMRLA